MKKKVKPRKASKTRRNPSTSVKLPLTKEDGGNLGTVPNTGRLLQNKISELFGTVLDDSDDLSLDIQMKLAKVLK